MESVMTTMKIQVDNDLPVHNNSSEDEEMEEGEASESSGESEVEINVIVGTTENNVPRSPPIPKKVDKERKIPLYDKIIEEDPNDSSYYPNAQDFYNQEQFIEEKIEERVKRFGRVKSGSPPIPKEELKNLYKSLDISESDFQRGGWRADAIHVRGIENMKSEEVFVYFEKYSPYNIEWLNENTCNVAWKSKEGAIKALIGISCPVVGKSSRSSNSKQMQSSKNNSTKEKKPDVRKSANVPMPPKKTVSSQKESSAMKSSTENSSDDDSSSDSEDDSSSSSSDSEDDSSSTSSSGSSSSDDSSSDSSSDDSDDSSSSSEEEMKNIDKVVEKSMNRKSEKIVQPKPPEPIMQSIPEPMQVALSDKLESAVPGSITASAIGVPLPGSGKWRLGVPCPNAEAIFLRFAHCKDKKDPRLNKPVDFYEEVPRSGFHYKQDSYHRHTSPLERRYETKEGGGKREIRRARRRLKPDASPEDRGGLQGLPQPPMSHRLGVNAQQKSANGYKDLDEPPTGEEDTKNPWGFLAQNWNKKATQEHLDYQSLLKQHITGKGMKRERSFEEFPYEEHEHDDRGVPVPSSPPHHSHREMKFSNRKKERRRYHSSEDDVDEEKIEEITPIKEESQPEDWNEKIRLPRMRMYADAEEKRTKVRPRELHDRIRSYKPRNYHNSAPRSNNAAPVSNSKFDLRAKLSRRKNNHSRSRRQIFSGSDGE